jgi:hypothetical protein
MSKIIPLDEFREIVNDETLTEEQLVVFRDIIDAQTSIIPDSFLAYKEAELLKSHQKDVEF